MKMKLATLGKLSYARPQADQLLSGDVGGATHQLFTGIQRYDKISHTLIT